MTDDRSVPAQLEIREPGHPQQVIVTEPCRVPARRSDVLLGLAAGCLTGLLGIFVSANVSGAYGWGAFIATPLASSVVSVLLAGRNQRITLGASLGLGLLTCVLSGSAVLLTGIEGLGCMLMAAPLWVPAALLGAVIGFASQAGAPFASRGRGFPTIMSCVVLAPLVAGVEAWVDAQPALVAVKTCVDVAAPPDAVWQRVVSFPELPPPTQWLFRAGIAYPIRARLDGFGVGATRYCEFSTGSFVEPIEVWDPPHRLRFAVTENPPPMQEWSPWSVHAPHLRGYLISKRGQFELTPLPDGRTRLSGTTWYSNRMWPAAYWRLWTDHIIGQVHRRVLDHIRMHAEADARRGAA